MNTRKLVGLFLIVMGLTRIFQALSVDGQTALAAAGSHYVFLTALMLTLGAALVWWNGKWRHADSHTQD